MPKVITWFKVYCGVLCFLYLAVAAMSLAFFLVDPEELDMAPLEAQITGSFLLALGIFFFFVCLVPFFLKPRPWVWIYDLVIICLGMTSACFLPASIPLLIYWLKPETKEYFGKFDNSPGPDRRLRRWVVRPAHPEAATLQAQCKRGGIENDSTGFGRRHDPVGSILVPAD